jgi:hypothetical protein
MSGGARDLGYRGEISGLRQEALLWISLSPALMSYIRKEQRLGLP